ncbi:MAG: LysR family transcriptional regulator [Rhodobacteraceae bacterium PARR1]|nr:MAG: LysR family transcriptional regulator [Rhodobacteraceae bacterium PARR1]
MGIDTWDEIRTAYQVARLGTVSGAAEVLGVHHATVIRHIDALEKRLGTRLFQRHARGYTPTEAGQDLLSVAQMTDEQFAQLASRIKGFGETVAGELTVTAITGMSELIAPVFAQFQQDHPDVIIRFLTDLRVFRLDYGEAHVAIRAGNMPEEPDNVVQPLARVRSALYAAPSYIDRHGLPKDEADLIHHRIVGTDNPDSRAPFARWLHATLPRDLVTFRASEPLAMEAAVTSGIGLGFLALHAARRHPDLIEVLPTRPEWDAPLWIVTHVDLHRTRKVQAFLATLKEAAKAWEL